MNYTATIYSDGNLISSLPHGEFFHTWVELTDNNGNKDIYSFNPKEGFGAAVKSVNSPVKGIFNPTDEPEARKERSATTTLDLTKDQYEKMKNTGDAFKENAANGTLDYALLQKSKNGQEAPNCVEMTSNILDAAGIHVLDNVVDPRVAGKLTDYLNQNGQHSLDDPNVRQSARIKAARDVYDSRSNSFVDIIQDYFNQFSGAKGTFIAPPRRDPIAVDLDNDGIETTGMTAGVYFDLDGNGTKEKTSWVKGDDGFIVMDRNNNGTIDSGKELFGDATEIKTANGTTKIATTGFEALAAEDTNADKIIDASDANSSKLKVWKDTNQDGISQADELKSLTDRGISKIHLDYLTVNTTDAQGNIQTRSSGFEFTDGRTGSTGEFLFDRNTIDTSNSDFSNVPPEIGFLPYLRGFGNVTDLYHAMANDAVLKDMVTAFVKFPQTVNAEQSTVNESSIPSELNSNFEKILFKWAGVDTIAADSRGPNIDAKKLAVLEKLFATNFEGWGDTGQTVRTSNPNVAAAAQLNQIFNNLETQFFSKMLVQSHLREYVMLGAVAMQEDGTVKVNENIADFILTYQKDGSHLSDSTTTNPDSLITNPDFQTKFFALANTVKVLGTASEKEEFLNYFLSKNNGIYANGLNIFSSEKLIIGGSNNDFLTGTSADNKIYGFEGNDVILSRAGGDNKIYAGNGDDHLSGGSGNDELYGGEGNDEITEYGGGSNVIDGGKGEDHIDTDNGSNTYIYRYGDGVDSIRDQDDIGRGLYDKLKFVDINPSDIYVNRQGTNLILTIKGTEGKSDGKITFWDWFSDHREGDDEKNQDFKMEEFEFADGTKWDTNKINESIVLGTQGDDIIDGGKWNDYLEGGDGNDTYIYRRGDGNDIIVDVDKNNDSFDKLKLLDINASDIFGRVKSGNDFILTFKNADGSAGETLTFKKWFVESGYNYKVEEIEFADGTKWNGADIEKDIQIYGTDGSDNIIGSSSNDTVYGGNGNDTINTLAGDDMVFAGQGDDSINAGNGNDVIYAEDGNDAIFGGQGDDVLRGGNGNDKIYGGIGSQWTQSGNDTIYGGDGVDEIYGEEGNDILDGGKDNDYLEGGEGNDTYIYRRGDGNDVIAEWNDKLYKTTSFDKLKLVDITPSDIERTVKSGNDFIITFKATDTNPAESIKFSNWFYGDLVDGRYNVKVEEIEFADGTKWGSSQIESNIQIYGTDGNDSLRGSYRNNTVFAGAGDDKINTLGGNDTVYAGDGNDTVNTGNNNDTVYGGAGDDKIYGEGDNDNLIGEEGNDSIYGGNGNDILDGGKGDDYLEGEKGNDTYIYRRGDGNDIISEWDRIETNEKTFDKVKLEDIVPSDIDSVIRSGDDLVVSFKSADNNPGEKITFEDWFYGDDDERHNTKIEEIEFADGSKWNTAEIENKINCYVYRRENGYLELTGDENDTLKLVGIKPENVELWYWSDNDMGIKITNENGTRNTVVLKNWFKDDDSCKLKQIEFVDDSGNSLIEAWDKIKIQENLKSIVGTDSSETIVGTDNDDDINPRNGNDVVFAGKGDDYIYNEGGDDTLYGEEGNDSIYGSDGKDTLVGGKGDDYLDGDANNDTYIYRKGDGNDVIFDANNIGSETKSFETLKLEGLKPTDIDTVIKQNNDLIIKFKGDNGASGGSITIIDWYYGDLVDRNFDSKMELIMFGNGVRWNAAKLESLAYTYGTDSNDVISASSINEKIFAGGGNDEVYAGAGNDVIYGGSGDDKLYGQDGNDNLYGEDGNDYLSGGSGKNILDGGKGDDVLDGGKGADTYVYRKGEGKDTVIEFDDLKYNLVAQDKIKLDGMKPSDIDVVIKQDNDLILKFKDSGDVSGGSITFKKWFVTEENGKKCNYTIEQIQFGNGDGWDRSMLERTALQRGTDGDDKLSGVIGADTVYAGKGNDTISGGKGNDVLFGEDGNDTIYGEDGKDVLDGGQGDDILDGGKGDDVYKYKPGEGNDIIRDAGGNDTLKVDAASNSMSFKKSMNDLQLILNNSNNILTLADWFAKDEAKIDIIESSDEGIMLTKKLNLLIQDMAGFEADRGMSWDTAIQNNDQQAKDILAQSWTFENKTDENKN